MSDFKSDLIKIEMLIYIYDDVIKVYNTTKSKDKMSEIKKTSLFESIVSAIRITTAIFIIVVIEIIRYSWALLPVVIYTLNEIFNMLVIILSLCSIATFNVLNSTKNIIMYIVNFGMLLSIKYEEVDSLQHDEPQWVYDCVEDHLINMILNIPVEVQNNNECESEIFYDCENHHKCQISLINIKNLNKEIQEYGMIKIAYSPSQEDLDEFILRHNQIFAFQELQQEIKAKYEFKNQKTFTLKIKGELARTINHKTKRALLGEGIKQDLILHNLNMNKIVFDHDKLQIENTRKKLQEIAKNNMAQQKEIINNIDKELERRNKEFEEQLSALNKEIRLTQDTSTSG